MSPARAPRGFTLLELVVSLALFALVSVMALQVLSGALHQNRVLERVDDQASAVLRTMALLRLDLNHASPMAFQTPIGDFEAAYLPGPDSLALSLGGLPRLPRAPGEGARSSAQDAGFQRVIWRHDITENTLTRQVWPVLNPRDPDQIGPEEVVLTGVRGLTLTPSLEDLANTGALGNDGDTNARDENGLPSQITVEIDTVQTGTLQVVVSPW
ncbi:MAG: type II secretion system protein GspJ [Pseudomonadota bacterium]